MASDDIFVETNVDEKTIETIGQYGENVEFLDESLLELDIGNGVHLRLRNNI